ncbi:hypothetical protein H312_02078, partial [Anncaliia algerae PRA339]
NKKMATILPIIQKIVIPGSTIFTDEHRSYSSLQHLGFTHLTVCHKYNFICPFSGAHTQFIESFHNELKLEIKRRKGIKTDLRNNFLQEFIWKFNNKSNRLLKLYELLKDLLTNKL